MTLADFRGLEIPPGVEATADRIAKSAERRWGAAARLGDPRAQEACERAYVRAAAVLWAGALAERQRS